MKIEPRPNEPLWGQNPNILIYGTFGRNRIAAVKSMRGKIEKLHGEKGNLKEWIKAAVGGMILGVIAYCWAVVLLSM